MKTKLFLLAFIVIIAACSKDEQTPEETKTTIGDEIFAPTDITVSSNGQNLMMVFTQGSKTVTIKTSDTIVGTYTISSESLKIAGLKANLTYNDGTTDYTATSGSVEIVAYNNGSISGIYSATVTSASNETLEISSGTYSEVTIEHTSTLLQTEAEINAVLVSCYSDFNSYNELLYLFDAVYSNVVMAPATPWSEIYNHSQTASNEKVSLLWTKAWDVIYATNLIIESSIDVISDETTLNKILGQTKALRAYTYNNLLMWFGEVPIDLTIGGEPLSRNSESEVLDQIKTDATEAVDLLPLSWSTPDEFRPAKAFAQSVLANIYLYKKEYNNAYSITEDIINSGNYALNIAPSNFTDGNVEIYYGYAKTDNTEFNAFFTKGDFIPVIRYTETILSNSESAYQLANTMDATQKINMLKARRNEQELPQITAEDIFDQWIQELELEGVIFSTLKRFNRASSDLGIADYQLILPIPQNVLAANPDVYQNPGY